LLGRVKQKIISFVLENLLPPLNRKGSFV